MAGQRRVEESWPWSETPWRLEPQPLGGVRKVALKLTEGGKCVETVDPAALKLLEYSSEIGLSVEPANAIDNRIDELIRSALARHEVDFINRGTAFAPRAVEH